MKASIVQIEKSWVFLTPVTLGRERHLMLMYQVQLETDSEETKSDMKFQKLANQIQNLAVDKQRISVHIIAPIHQKAPSVKIQIVGDILSKIQEKFKEDIRFGIDLVVSPSDRIDDAQAFHVHTENVGINVPNEEEMRRLRRSHHWYRWFGTTYCEASDKSFLPLLELFNANKVYMFPKVWFTNRNGGSQETDKFLITRKILNEEIHSDMAIKSKDGKILPCHKNFLSAHSSVFVEMINHQKKGNGCVIEIPELSEGGAQAFLDYLYTWELRKAVNNSEIAYELFHAAHVYGIGSLEGRLKKILENKCATWFGMMAALKLFQYVREMECCKDMETKAVHVLKTCGKEFVQTPEYKQLFVDDPMAAMDLCTLLAVAE